MTFDPPTVLGELEQAVMDHLWSCGPQDVKEVHRALGRARRITVNTIQSTLKRLYEKGLVERAKISHAYIYQARLSREAFGREVLGQVVDHLMSGASDAMLHAFVDLTERAGEDQLARLERMVALRRAQLERED